MGKILSTFTSVKNCGELKQFDISIRICCQLSVISDHDNSRFVKIGLNVPVPLSYITFKLTGGSSPKNITVSSGCLDSITDWPGGKEI